jgi:hypothetical protein
VNSRRDRLRGALAVASRCARHLLAVSSGCGVTRYTARITPENIVVFYFSDAGVTALRCRCRHRRNYKKSYAKVMNGFF